MRRKTVLLMGALLLHAGAVSAEEIDFALDIRPILSDKCFACHGPDQKHRQGGFRLDQKESALGEADSGEIPVVPGKPDESELIARITSEDDLLRMPPRESNKQLTAGEIDLLQRWIASGAEWDEHWAFVAPQRPAVPEVERQDRVRNEIDAFILKRLERAGRELSPDADRVTLIRRVTFDLTGLPPTPEEVDAFLNDESPQAYENVVDRLLASQRFGEHQARFWLDAARYGDTHGLHLDNYREMWPYRDWVIRAFNDNLPYDRFIIEQLAGDLLPEPTEEQLIATGFNRCHVTTNEGGSIAEEVRVRNVVDRVVTTGTVFMGMTFDCTRCHDHKFDPFTMEDFYALSAYFNSIDGPPLDGNRKDHAPVLKVPSPEQSEQMDELNDRVASLEKELNRDWPEVTAAQLAWEQRLRADAPESEVAWSVLKPIEYRSLGGAELELLKDDSILAGGPNPAKETYEVIAKIEESGWQGIRLEGLTHESLTDGGAGRSSNSNVVLTGFEVYVAAEPADGTEPDWKRVELSQAWADHEQPNGDFKIANAIDGKPETGWAIEGFKKKENRFASFRTQEPVAGEPGLVKVVLKHESQYGQHQFGRIRLSLTEANPIPTDVPQEILKIVRMDEDERDDTQRAQLREHFRNEVTEHAEYVRVRDDLAAVKKEREELDNQIPTTLIWREKKEPQPAHLLNRGEYDQPGEPVDRRTPATLPPLPEGVSNDRLGLARWLVDPSHPLTARVAVNRFWQQFFGTGIVRTSEDFGSQGEPPSHPQLLDWLAVQFIEEGWDTRQLLKRIVMSSTYRQSSKVTPELLQKDPANRLLARGPRFRLDAEMLRDQALFVSGLLVERIGGPSVKPPQPDGLWFAVGYSGSNTVRFKADEGPDKVHRRTVYTFIKRTAPPPQMSTFDGPSREACVMRRERTNTPLQALLLFNDPQYVEAAVALAARALRYDEAADSDSRAADAERAAWMFRLCTARHPSDEELHDLLAGIEQERTHYRAHPEAAEKLASALSLPLEEPIETSELAAWTMAANLLLNLDEVVTRN
jgi:hypothetical protein